MKTSNDFIEIIKEFRVPIWRFIIFITSLILIYYFWD